MNSRSRTFLQGVVRRFDSLLVGQDALEQLHRSKLASVLAIPAPDVGSILENKALTVQEFCQLLPFDRARRAKSVYSAGHKRQTQTVGVHPLETDIGAALSGAGDEVGILSSERTLALVLIVTVAREIRRERKLFIDRYQPSPILAGMVDRITNTIGAPFSFGFRLDTGVAVVYRFSRDVDSSVLETEASASLAVLSSKRSFKVRPTFTEKSPFFVPPRGSFIGDDLLPTAYDPKQILQYEPQALFPNVDRARAPVSPIVLGSPPQLVDPQLRRLVSALVTHFPQRQRLYVEEFLSRLFDFLVTRERTDYSEKFGVGAVSVSSRLLHDWHSDYGAIIKILVLHDVLRTAGNHSSGDKCYTARDRCYRLNRTANVPLIDRKDLILRLQNSGLDRQTMADKLGVALRTLWRWFKDPETVKMEKVQLIYEVLS